MIIPRITCVPEPFFLTSAIPDIDNSLYIISSFLIIIKQYDRAIILRLGKYQKGVGPEVQIRMPFADSVLVLDIREKVREFKAERMTCERFFHICRQFHTGNK
jgi:hypothetical protein